MSYHHPTGTDAAPRTRAVLLVVLASLTGVFCHIIYGPSFGLWGVAGGAAAALVLGALLARVVQWRAGR